MAPQPGIDVRGYRGRGSGVTDSQKEVLCGHFDVVLHGESGSGRRDPVNQVVESPMVLRAGYP